MMTWYIIAVLSGFVTTLLLTPLMRRLAERVGAVDDPAADPHRKRHGQVTPLLGGVAVMMATVGAWWALAWFGQLEFEQLPVKHLIGLTVAAGWLLIGGWLDDRWHLSPGRQLVWPAVATLTVVLSGIGVDFITNPFGGLLYLDQWQIQLWTWNGTPYFFTVWADTFSVLWLMGMMYTTKILDGLDGLVSGLGVIGAVIVFLLTLRPEVNQPDLALMALVFAGACLGFLRYNWHPAKIFLGEGGSLFIGFVLGVFAIISGGKIATALLIMGLPILDLAWVIIQRRFFARRSPFRTADRRHLHFRLVDAGLSIRGAVLTIYALTFVFGLATLWLHGTAKLVALLAIFVVLAGLVGWLSRRTVRSESEER